jgi:hypothetical protein
MGCVIEWIATDLVAAQMLDKALISAGLRDDAREMICRMNALMEKAMQ